MNSENQNTTDQGIIMLRHPVIPLVKILQLLYLTGPHLKISDLLDEFQEPFETGGATYDNPGRILKSYLPDLDILEFMKNNDPLPWTILNEEYEQVDRLESIGLMVTHRVLTRELETINSLLCGPCNCALCCIGPDEKMLQDFFEIPLMEQETAFFNLPKISTKDSTSQSPNSEPPLDIDGQPFYHSSPAVYKWESGWSLILPRQSSCPQLGHNNACLIYPDRPMTCRRPQIFAYALEPHPDINNQVEGLIIPSYIARNKILAIWDCPYVREFKQKIAEYAEMSELEPVFKTNKS
ncbi:YkgJ family cysteine cluster protein [Thermodesulfobacteriota bacterium]